VDVEDKAPYPAVWIAAWKRLGRVKCLHLEAQRIQAFDRPAHARIVFHDRDRIWSALHFPAQSNYLCACGMQDTVHNPLSCAKEWYVRYCPAKGGERRA